MMSSSNEIHDIDVVTAQTLTGEDSIITIPAQRVLHRHKSFKDLFPPFLPRKVAAEVIATFLLVFVTCGAAALNKNNPGVVSQLGASVAGGLIVTVMIYAVGHISGAHMNPAVTLAFAVSKHFPWIQVPFYWSAQFTGAMVASFILRELLHPITVIGTTTPSGTAARALVMEIIVTFSMMFVTLAVATDTRAVGELAGLAVGSAVCITSILAGPVSGGSMNPARTLGPAVASRIYDSLWVYFVGPALGTLSGAMAYKLIRMSDKPSHLLVAAAEQYVGSSSITTIVAPKSPSTPLKLRRMKSLEMASPRHVNTLDMSLRHVHQVHALASKTGLDADPLVAGKILLLAATILPDALDYARRLFFLTPSPDPFMYNTLIRGVSDSDEPPRHAVLLYSRMRQRSVPPDSFSFAFLLKVAANSKSLILGRQLHSHVVHHGLDAHLFVATTLVSMYAECGRIASARKTFDGIPQPNVVAWNAIMTAYFRVGDVGNAESVFDEMPLRNLTSWNIMLAGYTRAGELEAAKRLFISMLQKDSVSWSTMIVGFANHGLFNDAFGFFRQLLREGLRPNEVSLTGVLTACSQAGAFETGKILHGHMEKSGLNTITAVANALLDLYARCGSLEMARRVFNYEMGKKSVISWTSMIAALAMHGHGNEAIKLFDEMEKHGPKPDGVTFISLLYACSHSGMVEQGYHFFHKMEDAYGIKQSIEHYGCMVDLFGRAGLLEKAYDFIIQMPMEPNAIIWRTLLGACSIHGNVNLAELVRSKLSAVEPGNPGDYVLLSNIYAVAGKWKDVANVRRTMSNDSVRKSPGWSSIEVDKVVYMFVANDEQSSVRVEAHEKLIEIMSRLRKEGHVPEIASVLHDIEDEEKEDAIVLHSEKLAVAFGIARLSSKSVIRIVKNLRICKDCHVVMKLISKVYEREIVNSIVKNLRICRDCHVVMKLISKSLIVKNLRICRDCHVVMKLISKNSIVKNLRICRDCHVVMKLISKSLIVKNLRICRDCHVVMKLISKNSIVKNLRICRDCHVVMKLISKNSIVKNLRICGDCHVVMKLISKVYAREIVVRDRSRFHYFKDGSCSCRDYW
ncbi:hypothetical protein Cni_G25929 [Canna indica]|uniref:DYW domain-containing protein n=1 Tax=Canna indica TaxID=4628 RepID=A0AAQ3KYX5_9LILI|nr:hypothetical protein Cni_G25929 [Canna indica]